MAQVLDGRATSVLLRTNQIEGSVGELESLQQRGRAGERLHVERARGDDDLVAGILRGQQQLSVPGGERTPDAL
jgi:hypothetical protein